MKIFTFLFLLFTTFAACGQQQQSYPASPFERATFTRNDKTLLYRIMYPENYDPKKRYPVLLFLHGSGERGSDNEAQLKNGGSLFMNDTVRKSFPVIVIFPQCPADSAWNTIAPIADPSSPGGRRIDLSFRPQPTVPARLAKLLLDSLVQFKHADAKRMYVGGLSLGGFGTFDMIQRYPNFFAAAVPICGGGDTTMAPKFAKKTPVWLFHGDADKSVDVRNSREYYAALKRLNADVKYTEYPGVPHSSWNQVFAEREFLPWLLSKSKK